MSQPDFYGNIACLWTFDGAWGGQGTQIYLGYGVGYSTAVDLGTQVWEAVFPQHPCIGYQTCADYTLVIFNWAPD